MRPAANVTLRKKLLNHRSAQLRLHNDQKLQVLINLGHNATMHLQQKFNHSVIIGNEQLDGRSIVSHMVCRWCAYS